MDQQVSHRLTTSSGFFHPTFATYLFYFFQLPQVESNRTTPHVWSRFCLNRHASDRYLRERQAYPYRCCNWQPNMQICNRKHPINPSTYYLPSLFLFRTPLRSQLWQSPQMPTTLQPSFHPYPSVSIHFLPHFPPLCRILFNLYASFLKQMTPLSTSFVSTPLQITSLRVPRME